MPISRRAFTGAAIATPFLGLLGGCATSVNSLSESDLAKLRISEIKVTYRPDAVIVWPNSETRYLETLPAKVKPKPTVGYVDPNKHTTSSLERHLLETPEAKAFIQTDLSKAIQARLQQRVGPHFTGTRNARLDVDVISFVIPSAAMRVIVGGNPALGAIVTLRDASTGAELGKLDRAAIAPAGNGLLGVAVDQAFADLEDRVLDLFASNVENWMLKKA